MSAANHHLDDEALVRRYLAERGLEVLEAGDEPLLKHLAHCDACSARYASLTALLDSGRDAAVAQADAAFTPDRLAHQRDRIMRRLDAQSDSRVVAFPSAARPAQTPNPSPFMLRWVAAAAIAGLMVGVAAGHYIDIGYLGFGPKTGTAVASSGAGRPVPVLRPGAGNTAAADDDELLSKVDGALSTDERTTELAAIYALTVRGNDASHFIKAKY